MESIKFDISTDDLKYIFKSLRKATNPCSETYRFIKFEYSDGQLTCVSLDGYRMHSVSLPISCNAESFKFCVAPFEIPKTKIPFVQCELFEKEISFDFYERKFIEKTLQGEFEDYKEAIPTRPFEKRIALNPKYLLDAIQSLSQRCSTRNPVVIELRGKLEPVIIYNSQQRTDFRMVLPARCKEVDEC